MDRVLPLSLEQTWDILIQRGFNPPLINGRPVVPTRMPSYDDIPPLGLSFFRTLIDHVDLSSLTLQRTFFWRSEIKKVLFNNSDLTESKLCWCDWINCSFVNSNLSGCDFRGSNILSCDFSGSILDGVDFRGTKLHKCNFRGACMSGAKLTRIVFQSRQISSDQKKEVKWYWFSGCLPKGG